MTDTAATTEPQTTYPSVHPDVAARFSAIQLACAALWESDSLDANNRSVIEEARATVEWPTHLAARIDRYVEEPVSADDLEFNPYLSVEQVLLLFCATLLATGSGPIAGAWGTMYGVGDAELAFLWKRLQEAGIETGVESNDVARASVFLDPPDELLPFVKKQFWRLSLGEAELTSMAHVRPHLYEHRWDRQALQKMKSVTGFQTALRKFSEWHYEKIQLVMSQSERIRVGEDQFPELHELWLLCCERAGMAHDPPEFYVELGPLNAFTTGTENPQVVVSSALISLLSPRELMFVIGHELGHIRSEHVLYSMFAMWFPTFIDIVGKATLGIGSVLGKGLELAVLDWQRKAELTCDRFGLLCCQDFEASAKVLIKLAGAPPTYYDKINWEAFADQGRDYEADPNFHNKLYRWFLTAYQSHPWPAVRAHQLRTWVDEGYYEKLVGSSPKGWPNRSQAASADSNSQAAPAQAGAQGGTCVRCEAALEADDRFCAECGMRVPEDSDDTPLFCVGCGCEEIHEGDRFCPGCGNPL